MYQLGGPNFLWHWCDGYDKLKPFGFPIHGGIDGLRIKVLWLHVVISNNNPATIAGLFLKATKDLEVFPQCVRTDYGTDCGTENGLLAAAHFYFNRDHDHKTH